MLSVEEVKTLISSSSLKSCSLDPVPTTVLKNCSDFVAPLITHIINKSLSKSFMPRSLKQAIVLSLLKKASLEKIPKNYRPVSNLPFLGKLIEKAVSLQFTDHIDTHSLSEPLQSAYKKLHSTETALIKITNDILVELDNRNIVLAGLLDLSAAFDTVDYEVLFRRLETSYAFDGAVMAWFRSYLSDRSQVIAVSGCTSSPVELDNGMPQGSILGPKVYNEYTMPLGILLRLLAFIYHSFADDSQLLKAANPNSTTSQLRASQALESAIDQVGSWMNDNRLKLNEDKTEFLVFSSKRNSSTILIESLTLGEEIVQRVPVARNLGVHLDSELSYEHHIKYLCKVCYANIKAVWKIRRYLTHDATKTVIHALVISKLDYANALLFGIPEKFIRKLQLVQNSAARVVTLTKRSDHIKPALKSLHWLPVKERIQFKISVLVFKARNGLSPDYLAQMLTPYEPPRKLRSSTGNLLVQPSYNLKGYGHRAFSVAGPQLWNQLPDHIRSCNTLSNFKRNLKAYYFRKAYGSL